MRPNIFSSSTKYLIALGALFAAGQAQATVMTTSCAAADTCSLQELYDGGSISVNDVTFDGFIFDAVETSGALLDPNNILVSGIDETVPGMLGLTFTLINDEGVFGDINSLVNYDWDFNASVTTGSRTIAGSTLDMTGGASITGDAAIGVNADVSNGGALGLLDVRQNIFEGLVSPDSLSFLMAQTILSFDTDIQLFAFADGAFTSLQSFTLFLELEGDLAPPIPLPAAFPLMLAGIAGLGLVARRRGKTKR